MRRGTPLDQTVVGSFGTEFTAYQGSEEADSNKFILSTLRGNSKWGFNGLKLRP